MRNAKRVITLLVTMVLLVLGVADAVPGYAYAQNLKTMQKADGNLQTLSQDMNIEGSNSLGRMIASELTAKQEEQRENNGCNLFSAEVDKKCVTVSLETVKDGTLVAAIYEEDGIKILASGTTMVKAGDEKAEVTIDTDSMPSYFYLRVFLVDSDTLQPLASSYESPNYTKEMQEFLSKTTEDFNKDRVYNLDEDKTTNFAVYNEDTQVIPQSNKVNRLVSTDEEKKQYTFENVDENITSLSAGDIFVYDMGDNKLLVVKVANIQKKGTTAIISGEDTSLEEAFDYVKIEGDADTSKVTVDDSTCEEGVVYNGMVEETGNKEEIQTTPSEKGEVTAESSQVDAIDLEGSISRALSYTFLDKKLAGGDTNNINLSGGVELKSTVSLKLYIAASYQYMELKMENSLNVNLSIEGKAKGTIPLGTLGFMPVAGVIIEITPKFVVEASAKIEAQGTLKWTVGFSVSSGEGMRNLSSFPNFQSSGIQTEGTIFIGLSLDPRVAVICDEIVKVGFKSEVGAEIKGTISLAEPASDSEIHSCNKCIDGDISLKFTLAFEAKLLNSEKWEYRYDKANVSVKITDFYYSFDHGEGDWTVCPYLKYKLGITVKDENGNPLEDAKAEAPFSIVDVDPDGYKEIKDVTVITTDKKGTATGYLSNGTYTIKVSKDGYENAETKITIKDTGKSVEVTLKKESGNNNGNSSSNGTTISDIIADSKTVSLELGEQRSAAITKDGSLYMWGEILDMELIELINNREEGSIGLEHLETAELVTSPKKIMDNVVSVSFGERHSGAITKDGSLYMWGENREGEMGDGTTTCSNIPKKIMDNVAAVNLGFYHSGAITKDGSLYMWGANFAGQLGDGTITNSYTPKKIMENVAAVSLGERQSGAITKDGRRHMWGDVYGGAYGLGRDDVAAVSLGERHSGAITKDGSLYMWGNNDYGQLGDGTKTYSGPKKIMENVAAVSVGRYHSGAITKDGSLYMWGNNGSGRLGDGTTTNSYTPKKIMENVAAVSLGDYHSGAITKDGSLYMWGSNGRGQLGDGTTTDRHTPVKVMDNLLLPSTIQSSRISSIYSTQSVGSSFSAYVNRAQTDKSRITFSDLSPDTMYTFYGVKARETEDILSSSNLLYINQAVSDSKGNISFEYALKEEYDNPELFLGGVEADNTGDVTITPATEAPATEVPATEVPVTETPATKAPATEVPVTEVPATEAPATEVPVTEVPTTEAPATEVPVTETPATKAPATEVPVTDKPVTTKIPVITKEPTTTATPVITKEPMVTVTPVATKEPTTTVTPTITKEPTTTVTPVATKEPTTTVTPVATKEPTTTVIPNTTETPLPPTNTLVPAKKGTVLKVTDKKCKVKVLSASTKNPTVAYQGTTDKKAKSITIPATVTVDGVTYKVTVIANSAFAGNKKITKVTIGENITTIGKKAFQGCSALKNIVVKTNNLKTVGKNALKGTNKKLVIKVPSKKLKNYKKYFQGKGNKKVKVKK